MQARNWLCALIGIWFIVSPWALGLAHGETATPVSIVVGLVQVIASVWAAMTVTSASYKTWQNWVVFLCGFWFVIHPFLGEFEDGQYLATIIPAILTMAFSLWTLMASRTNNVSRF